MRKLISLLFVLFFISISMYSQNSEYIVRGDINKQYDGNKVYLSKFGDDFTDLINIDSTIIENGKFGFKGILPNELSIRFIKFNRKESSEPVLFIPEKGTINVKLTDSKSTISGTSRNDGFQNFMDNQISSNNIIKEIIDSSTDKVSETEASALNQRIDSIYKEMANARYKYSFDNIQNNIGEFIFLTSLEIMSPDSILDLLSKTRPIFKDSDLGKNIKKFYISLKSKTLGNDFTDLELLNTEGKRVKLSDYIKKDKIVLLDFWASWCGPCIKEMPNLLEIYNKYKNKGFEIVGISFDDKQSSWIRGIEKLNITWPQLSDLKGWNSIASETYAIKSIPYTLLIDKDGKIIANNIKGEELQLTLNKLLNTNK